MMELGRLLIEDAPAFDESRRKLFALVRALGFDALNCSRLVSLVSALIRPEAGLTPAVTIFLDRTDSQTALCVEVSGITGNSAAQLPDMYLDSVTRAETDGKAVCRFTKSIPAPCRADEDMAANLRAMLARPSREELMRDLQRSESRLLTVLEGAPDALLMVDTHGAITFLNSRAEKNFGYAREELLGQPIEILVPDTMRPGHEDRVATFFREEQTRSFSETANLYARRKDGSLLPVDIKLRPLRTESGLQAIAAIRDVTAQRKYQRERDEALDIVSSSIRYASRIQRSVLPTEDMLNALLAEYCVVWEPRDVVGGDMYWSRKWGEGLLMLLADCTGHGVPGAFMTLISCGALDLALAAIPEGDPAALIRHMHSLVQQVLSQSGSDSSPQASDDGLALGVCYIAPDGETLVFAGADIPLFVALGESVTLLKSSRTGIGYRGVSATKTWTNHVVPVEPGMRFYMASDGVFDQIGGTSRRGFGKKRFMRLLASLRNLPLNEQGQVLYNAVQRYQGNEIRRDDISVIGFRPLRTAG